MSDWTTDQHRKTDHRPSQQDRVKRLFDEEIRWFLNRMFPPDSDRSNDAFETAMLWMDTADKREREIIGSFLDILSEEQKTKFDAWKRTTGLRWFVIRGRGRYDLD